MPPRRQWIDKKNAATYQLFHRSQHDPLIHDPNAEDRVLHQISGPKQEETASTTAASSASHKTSRNLTELATEFGAENVRKNEGEAANYGVFYDDSKYDYMQHLRELGTGGGNSYFVEAAPNKSKGKEKTVKLEDALRDFSIEDSRSEIGGGAAASVYGSEYTRSTASSYVRKPTYQDQQNVPDAIAGFQPNMDPRLREALEALDDEAFVDDEDDQDIFGELTRNAEEIDAGDWEDTLYDQEDDDGWESDVTEKAFPQSNTAKDSAQPSIADDLAQEHDPSEMPDHDKPVPDITPENADWMREFAKFKKDGKTTNTAAVKPDGDGATEKHTTASTMFTVGGTPIRKKKRKGAMTNPSAYSMTSSSLARTEGLRLLDDRFEKVEALYALDEEGEYDDASFADGASMVSGMTGMTGMSAASSQAPSLVSRGDYGDVPLRSDFDNVMDDFLSGWQDRSKQTKRKGAKAKRGKNGNEALGIAMLDEVRQGLGPARLSAHGKA